MALMETLRKSVSGLFFGEAARVEVAETDNITIRDTAAWIIENLGNTEFTDESGKNTTIAEAFTQADIELAIDDRGWLVGGKRMAGELDPLSRQVQVNRSRYYWLRDPLAKQSVRLWTDYALGDMAMSWSTDDTEAQQMLDGFMYDRRNRSICSRKGQRTLCQRLLVDGEIFLLIWDDNLIRNVDCLTVTDIITDPDEEGTVWGYKRVMTPRMGGENPSQSTMWSNKTLYYYSWEAEGNEPLYDPVKGPQGGTVQAEKGVRMYHLPFDNLTQRGNPLISCCSDWSREHRRFMVARVALMQSLAKFAWKANVKGGQKMINTVRAKLESTFAQTGLSGGTEHQPPTAPGGTWVGNDGVNVEPYTRSTGGAEAKSDGDQLKLMMCAGTGIFLHYYGDPSTGNLATATAMELPMLKQFMSFQVMWKDFWKDIFGIVIDEDDPNELQKITVELPPILEDDLQKLAMFLTNLTQVWPEAKVPELLRQALMSANVNNIDDVMKAIEEQRKTIDANNKLLGLAPGLAPGKPVTKIPNGPNGTSDNNPTGTQSDGIGSIGADGYSGGLEADRFARLTAAVEKLAEVMR